MDALKEGPEVLRINSRRDTVSQVRDPPFCFLTAFETLAHPLDLPLNRLSPAIQYVGIQVALERDTWTDGFPSNGWVDAPVQPDHVVAAGLSDTFEGAVRSLGEESERDNGELLGLQLLPKFCGDVLEGGQRELCEIVGREFAGPRVKNLEELRGRGA